MRKIKFNIQCFATISNYNDYTLVSGTAYADSIHHYYAWYSTIDGGADNDIILVDSGKSNSINGGAGNDKISLSSSAGVQTVTGGTGSDTIYGDTANSSGVLYQYKVGDGNDVIYNVHSNDTVSIGGGSYTTSKSGSNTVLSAGSGAITLVGSMPVVKGTATTTTATSSIIVNTTANSLVNGTSSGDTIKNTGKSAKIYGNGGNDSIRNEADSATIFGGDGKDTLHNVYNNKVSIFGGDGADFLQNSGSNVTMTGGTGNDTIENVEGYNVTINGGDGADSINNLGDTIKISGDAGNDYIHNYLGGSITILGGTGEDTIENDYSWDSMIDGGSGDDKISINASQGSITVIGGTGNDKIYGDNVNNYGVFYQYKVGDGNDIIYNVHSNDTVSIGGGSYSTSKSGSNTVLSAGSGAITLVGSMPIIKGTKTTTTGTTVTSSIIVNTTANSLVNGTSSDDTIWNKNSGRYAKIYGNNGNDSIYNSGSNATLSGGDGADTIYNVYSYGGDTVSISGGTGTDYIYNDWGWYATIDGGADNDTISVYRGAGNSINGGAGDDKISLSSSGGIQTVIGGYGDDTIYGDTANSSGVLYQYKVGDGNDVIYNIKSNDVISIGGGRYTTTTSGNNLIVNAGSGAITLIGAKNKSVSIDGTYGGSTTTTVQPATVSAQNVIKKFMDVLDTVTSSGVAALNKAVQIASNGYFSSAQAVTDQMVADCRASGGTNFLKNKCGIILDNADTGAITGSDAGGSTTKTATSIVPESGTLDNSFTGNSFTVNGLTIKLASFDNYYNPSAISYSSLTNDSQRYIWKALKTWWADSALDLIAESYGSNYNLSNKTYYFGFVNNKSYLAATNINYMMVNLDYYRNVDTSGVDGNMKNRTTCYLDRVLAHEFTHAVMMNNINSYGFWDLPQFITEGMAELTHGADDDRKPTISSLAGNATALSDALSLDFGTGTTNAYAGGYMWLRYFAKQVAENSSSSSAMSMSMSSSHNVGSASFAAPRDVSINGAVLTVNSTFQDNSLSLMDYVTTVTKVDATKLTRGISIIGNEKANSIKTGSGADTISGNSGNDTIYGGAGNDYIVGDAGNDKLYGDAGNDTISGGTGTDTLTGGSGNDVFIHTLDYDYIADYEVGKDKIKLAGSSITGSSVKGSDVILKTVGENFGISGEITIKGGKGKSITVIDSANKTTSKVYGNSTVSSSSSSQNTLKAGLSYDSSKKKLSVATVYSGSAIDLANFASTVVTVDASKFNKTIKITGNGNANSIAGGSKNDTLYGGAGKDKLLGNAGNDKLYGGNDNDSLSGGAGADTLSGDSGNDTLTGGAGNDVFVYSAGKDVITDYTAGQDKIKINSGYIKKSQISGNNIILTIGSGTLTVKNGKGKKITVTDSSNNTITKTYTNATYSSSTSGMLDNEDMWFMDGVSEFVSENANIDSVSEITANNYSVGSISSALSDSLTADSYDYQATYATNSNKIK